MQSIDASVNGKKIRKGLAFSDLVGDGTTFELEGAREDFVFGAEDEYELDDLKEEAMANPYSQQLFADLALDMVKVSNFIQKKILVAGQTPIPQFAEVKVHYNGFFEGQEKSFDSTYLRGGPLSFIIGSESILQGIQMAVRTMKKGEESLFIISYKVLLGEHGCPPRIPPKADALFLMKLLDVQEISQVTEQEYQTDFFIKFTRASVLDATAKEFFNKKNYREAIAKYRQAVDLIDRSTLKDAYEEKTQIDFLCKLYLNLTVCYNKIDIPKKACTSINEMKKLRKIRNNPKALYQEGLALLGLNEYGRARESLDRARTLNPSNEDILNALQRLTVQENKQKEEERIMCANALNVLNISRQTDPEPAEDPEFVKVRQILKDFQNSPANSIMLPTMFTAKEMSHLRKLGPEFFVGIEEVPTQESIDYRLVKKPHYKNPFAKYN